TRGRLYLSDSHPSVRTLWRLPLETASGSLGERQQVARFGKIRGRPDGAAIDAEGSYWIAGVGGAVLHRFSPADTRIGEVATPMASPTKPVFGGAGLATVFLTSKAGATGEPGGCLFKATPG